MIQVKTNIQDVTFTNHSMIMRLVIHVAIIEDLDIYCDILNLIYMVYLLVHFYECSDNIKKIKIKSN